MSRALPAAYVDRVSDSTVLVMSTNEGGRTITVWRTSDKRRWVVEDQGSDVDDRTKLDSAVSVALRRLGVDPSDPTIERDDER